MNGVAALLLSFLAASGCGRGEGARAQEIAFRETRLPAGQSPGDVLVLDADRDGALDVVVSGGDSVRVFLGGGDGTFEAGPTVPAGPNPVDPTAGDFDRDGRVDLAVANHDTDFVTLLFGSPEGVFVARSGSRLRVGVSPHPHALAARDMDGDGALDLIVDDREARAVRILPGRGDGTFDDGFHVPVGGDPYRGFVVEDLNGDGAVDLATPNRGSVAVLVGDGEGGFTPAHVLEWPGLRPFSVAAADLDGDGLTDLGVGSGEEVPGRFVIWLGRPDGGFRPAPGSPISLGPGPTGTSAGDVDGNGTPDFVVVAYAGDEAVGVLGGGDRLRAVRIPVTGNRWRVAAGDLDGDGRADFITPDPGAGEVSIFLTRPATGERREVGVRPPGPGRPGGTGPGGP